jgi:hypothetical protein
LKNHRSKSKEECRKNTPLYKHFNEIGWKEAVVELLTEQDFLDKRDMLECEKAEIMKYFGDECCLNHDKPIITKEEKKERDKVYGLRRRAENPEHERERVATWRINNPDKYAQQVARSVEQQRQKRLLAKRDTP